MNRLTTMIVFLGAVCLVHGPQVQARSEVREGVLSNGLAYHHLLDGPGQGLADFIAQFEVGSGDEKRQQAGISHLLEHIIFQTITTDGATVSDWFSINGIIYNGWTSPYHTQYASVGIPQDQLEDIIAIWAKALFNPLYPDQTRFRMERQVVCEEILLYMSDDVKPMRTAPQALYSTIVRIMTGKPAIMSWDPGGFKRIVADIGWDELRRYQKEHYTPEATSLIISSALSHETVVSLLEKHFGHIPGGTRTSLQTNASPSQPNRPFSFDFVPNLVPDDISYLAGFWLPAADTRQGYEADIMCDLLTKRIQREDHRTFTIGLDTYNQQRGPGPRLLIAVGSTTERSRGHEDFPDLEAELATQLRRMKQEAPDRDELFHVCYHRRLHQSNAGEAQVLAQHLQFSTSTVFKMEHEWLSAITPETIKTVAHQLLDIDHAAFLLAGEGPYLLEIKNVVNTLLFLGLAILPLLMVLGLHFSSLQWFNDKTVTLYLVRPIGRLSLYLARLSGFFLIGLIALAIFILFIQLAYGLISQRPNWGIWKLYPYLALVQIGAVLIYDSLASALKRPTPALILSLLLHAAGNFSLYLQDSYQNFDHNSLFRVPLKAIYTIIPRYDQIKILALQAVFGTDPENVTGLVLLHFAIICIVLACWGFYSFRNREI